MEPPFRPRPSLTAGVVGVLCLLLLLSIAHRMLDPGGGNVIGWTIRAVIALALLRTLLMIGMAMLTRAPHTSIRPAPQIRDTKAPTSPGTLARRRIAQAGGGAYLGIGPDSAWVTADPESAVMILGPPRSGKTSAVMIPA